MLAAKIGVCICTLQIHRLSRMGILELSVFQNYVSETRSWNAIIFLLHYPGKNEFITFISPFLIKSLMPISHLEHCQISDSATIRIECMFEQCTVGLWQINFWEMENIYIWLTSSQPEINPLYNLATMSFGCEQGTSFVLWEPAYQTPGPCCLFCFSCNSRQLHLG